MKKRVFTQTNIIGNCRIMGCGYDVTSKNEIRIIGLERNADCVIDRVNDTLRVKAYNSLNPDLDREEKCFGYEEGYNFLKFMATL